MQQFLTRKALPLAVLCMALALPANATPELAKAWGEQASELYSQLNDVSGEALPEDLEAGLERFGRTATRLAGSGTDSAPLPTDLGCIFRGMAEETRVQLEAIHKARTSTDAAAARKRLLSMLDDAKAVSQSAELAMLEGGVSVPPSSPSEETSCGAAKLDFDQYLSEQP